MRVIRWLSLAVVVSSLSAASAACSSSSNGGGGGGDCASLASAVCQKLASCYPFGLQLTYGTVDFCTTRTTAQCQSGLQEPGVTMGADYMSRCSAAYASTSCESFDFSSTLPGCEPQAGTLANGMPCGSDVQCQSLFCNTGSATCGACAAAPKVGDACTGSCGAMLTCTNGKCATEVAHGGLGAQCMNAPCTSTLTCFNGTCSTPTAEGQACGPTKPNCDGAKGLTCSPNGVCVKVKLANPGEACGSVGTGYVMCAAQAKCKTASGSTSGTCLAPAEDGQACDEMNGPYCKAGASCINGKCTLDAASSCH